MNKTVEDFKKTWEEQIAKIEKRPIDSRGTYLIYLDFSLNRGRLELTMTEEESEENLEELNNLESKVRVALETSRSLFSLQNRSIWARIAESIAVMTYNKLPR
jgi:hypothetical protein